MKINKIKLKDVKCRFHEKLKEIYHEEFWIAMTITGIVTIPIFFLVMSKHLFGGY